MTFDALLELLRDSIDPAAVELVADSSANEVRPLSPESPGREGAGSLSATFAIRSRTTAAAGIRTLGLDTTVTGLRVLAPEDPILLFHFSGAKRIFSVFVREVDLAIVGVVLVERVASASS